MIVPNYFEDLSVLHVNTMPNRAYYIPNTERDDRTFADRKISERFQLLNGQWAFRYFSSIYEVKEAFFEEGADISGFGESPVPSLWQCEGYDGHQYTNTRYPIPFDPPYVPRENPCGAYVTRFCYQKRTDAPRVYLNFEGVDSCFYVWLNGSFVGYSQVSHSTSEFDITAYLREGENTLAVLVLKWCDGTYLEDQDKFRMSGIFRDVYLLHRPEEGIFDYFVKAIPNNNYQDGTLELEITYFDHEIPVWVSLLDEEGNTVAEQVVEGTNTVMKLEHIRCWNAEQPYLYTLILKTDGETILDWVGFREIHVENSVLLVNGVPVKFHGVNRHDSDPETGFVISDQQMMTDLRLMKEHHINAIRTSHYPNAPHHYLLFDRLGFYVIDEADNESHGTDKVYKKTDDWDTHKNKWNERIADNPLFTEATVDRTRRCVERDKNRPSVLIWSMGNECAYGCTFEAALAWTKEFDSTRLCHYEGARYVPETKSYDFSNIDLYSRMYPDMQEIEAYCTQDARKPYLMCEYAHAMGNGPGDLEDYFQVIHKYDCMCGGFIWEWCDHAMFMGTDENGKKKYGYGGDFGEYPHDGNFCMDGLVYPDRRPHTGLLEFKNVYRPLRVVSWDAKQKRIVFKNYLDFVNAGEYLTIRYELVVDGAVLETGEVGELDIPPHQIREANLEFRLSEKELYECGKTYLRITYRLKRDWDVRKAGWVVGTEEIRLNVMENSRVSAWKTAMGNIARRQICCQEGERYIQVSASDFHYVYDKFTGTFCELSSEGRSLMDAPMEYNIWRAPTDNDRRIKQEWMRAGYDRMQVRTYSTEITMEDSGVCIRTKLALSAPFIQRILDVEASWTVLEDGGIQAALYVVRDGEFPSLPRFGIRMFLPKECSKVEYCGIGPVESYVDKHQAGYHGVFEAKVDSLHEDYIRPQENGSRHDCDYVRLFGENREWTVFGETPFDFNVSPYTQEELTVKKHNFELEESPYTVLCIDYQQNGIGSASCGPELIEKYRFEPEEFTFQFNLLFSVNSMN